MRALIGNRGAWAGLVLLGACASEAPQQQEPASTPPPTAPVSAPVVAPTRPAPKEPSIPLVKPSPSPTESMLSQGPPAPPSGATALSIPPAASLIGLSFAELEARMGRPTAEFARAPAKVWQYRVDECVLDVYFYLDVARNAFHSLHHDAKRNGVQDESCVRRIQNARRQS